MELLTGPYGLHPTLKVKGGKKNFLFRVPIREGGLRHYGTFDDPRGLGKETKINGDVHTTINGVRRVTPLCLHPSWGFPTLTEHVQCE